MARVTLTQVAKTAGVSAPTASAVLHNTAGNNSGFSEKTKEKVLAAAEKLGYRPNRTTRNFYRKRHGQIGMVVAPDGWLPGETLEAMSHAARQNDQMLVFERGEIEKDVLPISVTEDAVDGLVLIGEIDEKLDAAVKKLKMPLVHVNSNRRGVAGAITYGEQGGMAKAVEHLAQKGRKHIGFITEPVDGATHYSVRERWMGIINACEKSGLSKPPVLELENVWLARLEAPLELMENCRMEIQSFFERTPALDAVVVAKSVYAPPTYQALLDLGKDIPGDVAVVGVNPYSTVDYMSPRMTSVSLDFDLLGKTIIDLINVAIDSGQETAKPQTINMILRPGGSS